MPKYHAKIADSTCQRSGLPGPVDRALFDDVVANFKDPVPFDDDSPALNSSMCLGWVKSVWVEERRDASGDIVAELWALIDAFKPLPLGVYVAATIAMDRRKLVGCSATSTPMVQTQPLLALDDGEPVPVQESEPDGEDDPDAVVDRRLLYRARKALERLP